jgi:membrane associated rhomboid family serine protease
VPGPARTFDLDTIPLPEGARALLGALVDVLITKAEGAAEARAWLVHKNPGDAVISLRPDGLTLILLACGPAEMPGPGVLRRIDAALAAEPDDVREALRDTVVFVVFVGGAGDLAERLPVLPEAHEGLDAALVYLRVTGNDVEAPTNLPAERDPYAETRADVRDVLTWALRALGTRGPAAMSAEALEAAEREGEGALRAAGRYERSLRATPAVISLIAANVAMFLGEIACGGGDSTQVLARMGGNRGYLVFEHHEWFRLLSAGYLHAGLGHVASNVVSLYMFGVLLEAALGPARFLLFYTLCVAGSEIATGLVQPGQLGIGASGGVFGLMGGLLALSLRGRDVLPPGMRKAAFGMSAFYIVFNLVYSLLPGISLLAHVSGAVVGALLCGTGAITAGMRPITDAAPERSAVRFLFRGLAALSVAVTAACIGLGIRHGKPWQVRFPPRDARVSLTGTPLRIDVPASMLEHTDFDELEGGRKYVLGEALFDPLVLSIIVRARPGPVPETNLDAALGAVRQRLAEEPLEKGEERDPPRIVEAGDRKQVVMETRLREGQVRLTRWVFFVGDREVDVQSSLAPDAVESWAKRDAKAVESIAWDEDSGP